MSSPLENRVKKSLLILNRLVDLNAKIILKEVKIHLNLILGNQYIKINLILKKN